MRWWIWPIAPAVIGVFILATSDKADRLCADTHAFELPAHPEQCLPTLFGSLTGSDPLAIAVSWLIVGIAIYLLVVAGTSFLRTRGFR